MLNPALASAAVKDGKRNRLIVPEPLIQVQSGRYDLWTGTTGQVGAGDAMSGKSDPFEASAAALGYLYQLRMALLVCVEHLQTGFDWTVAIEAGDDIETVRGASTDWWQLKHRAPGTRMTDASSDLWKTLRIWATAVSGQQIDLERANLFLLTTGIAPEGTVGSYLAPSRAGGPRNEAKALTLLNAARGNSAAKSPTALANFAAWDALDQDQRLNLLKRIQVLDEADNIMKAGDQLQGRAALVVGHAHAQAFLQRLEGWFFQRCIAHLAGKGSGPVTGVEFDDVFDQRRNQFRPDNLPIDADVVDLTGEVTEHTEKTFVRQLTLAGIGNRRIRMAVRDYVRAYEQRSRWSNENLLRPGELGNYERRLVEEWERRFNVMVDDLGEDAAETEMRAQAKKIYAWVEQDARTRIREGCDEAFVTTGSYQMLADEQRVGWHPDFEARLMALLEPTVGR
ncbi:ABC-three component system protein [Streptomyces sp. NPDC020898]|uniref:ABC-three component system protein n=1 Tax=Streptomyces sp. NPDC020898 TaxID=3365101 RepID=UPI0037AB9AF1